MEQNTPQPDKEKNLQFFLDEVAKEYTDYEFWDQVENAFTGDRDFSTELAQYELEAHKRFHAYQLQLFNEAANNHDKLRVLEIHSLKEQLEEADKTPALFFDWLLKNKFTYTINAYNKQRNYLLRKFGEATKYTAQQAYEQFKQQKQ